MAMTAASTTTSEGEQAEVGDHHEGPARQGVVEAVAQAGAEPAAAGSTAVRPRGPVRVPVGGLGHQLGAREREREVGVRGRDGP